jgi:hypothetical protein
MVHSSSFLHSDLPEDEVESKWSDIMAATRFLNIDKDELDGALTASEVVNRKSRLGKGDAWRSGNYGWGTVYSDRTKDPLHHEFNSFYFAYVNDEHDKGAD